MEADAFKERLRSQRTPFDFRFSRGPSRAATIAFINGGICCGVATWRRNFITSEYCWLQFITYDYFKLHSLHQITSNYIVSTLSYLIITSYYIFIVFITSYYSLVLLQGYFIITTYYFISLHYLLHITTVITPLLLPITYLLYHYFILLTGITTWIIRHNYILIQITALFTSYYYRDYSIITSYYIYLKTITTYYWLILLHRYFVITTYYYMPLLHCLFH